MIRSKLIYVVLAWISLSASLCGAQDKVGFVDLFNGKTLEGWTQRNGTATYRVEDGSIVGTTAEGSPNSFCLLYTSDAADE